MTTPMTPMTPMTPIIYEQIDINHVLEDTQKLRFNSNNHGERPADYYKVLDGFNTRFWIDKFHSGCPLRYEKETIDLLAPEWKWMKECEMASCKTGTFNKTFSEELTDAIRTMPPDAPGKLTKYGKAGAFIRTENVSLKYGEHGAGPYCDWKKVIESTCSSIRGHSPLSHSDDGNGNGNGNGNGKLVYYILPWKNIDAFREFRAFVYNSRITCISQQNLYYTYPYDKKRLESDVGAIISYFDDTICEMLGTKLGNNYKNCSMDIAITDENVPYFIEFNSFGKEYAAGSSLFHWIHDQTLLYATDHNIHVRYTTSSAFASAS
jgi:hypothetical protein